MDLEEALLDDGEVAVEVLHEGGGTYALMEKVMTSLIWMLLAISVRVCVDDIKFISINAPAEYQFQKGKEKEGISKYSFKNFKIKMNQGNRDISMH